MKKFLLATTALVATTGVAVADMAVTGSAEMGLFDPDSTDQAGIRFFQDVDVAFTGSGSTDSGLAFGFAVDLDEGSGDATGNDDDDGGVAIFLSSDFGTVTMGDTDGAMDWAMTEAGNIGNPGSINDDETSHMGYNDSYLDGNHDGQILRYDHSIANIGFAFSIEMDDDTATSGTSTTEDGVGADDKRATTDDVRMGRVNGTDERPQVNDGKAATMTIGLGAKYALDVGPGSLGLGGGFQMGQDAQDSAAGDPVANTARIFDGLAAVPVEEYYDTAAFGVSAVYSGNAGYSVGLQFAQITVTPSETVPGAAAVNADAGVPVVAAPVEGKETEGRKATALTHIGFGGGYATGPWSVHANYGTWTSDEEEAVRADHEVSKSGFGLAAGYSLGGGAAVRLGYSSSTPTEKEADAINKLSIGLSMAF